MDILRGFLYGIIVLIFLGIIIAVIWAISTPKKPVPITEPKSLSRSEPSSSPIQVRVNEPGIYFVNWSPNQVISMSDNPQFKRVMTPESLKLACNNKGMYGLECRYVDELVATPDNTSIEISLSSPGVYFLYWGNQYGFRLVRDI